MAAVMRTIRYTTLDGQPKAVDYWFQLGKTDAIELDFVHRKNPKQYLESIAANQETRNLMEVWKDMLFRAVGKRKMGEDGEYIVKNPQILEEFVGSGAYEQLFNELAESQDGGAAFFLSIMPKEVQANADAEAARVNRDYSNDELLAMSDEDFYAVAGTKKFQEMDKRFQLIAWERRESGRQSA
ncbi:hypothetical protein SEA_BING_52 [Streptomyces phage Bing]|uniref:Tail assembly chaperone n=1 Tax=Streptomyces phage Bing TaxID=2079427 RepID=A0A2L1IWC1_9CAUD|nr:hypothetical protein FDJ31_gp52 [Streptomyces phage Bing]AVD99474.1 hypothetical protein SEA_BING_52 [Streptomyces phage Bing]